VTKLNNDIKKTGIRKWAYRVVLIILLSTAFIYGIPKVKYIFSHVSTDDAYIHATIIPIKAEVDGKAVKVFITDNQLVKKGDLLLKIEDNDYNALVDEQINIVKKGEAELIELENLLAERKRGLEEAVARVEKWKAEENFANTEEKRYHKLLNDKLVSKSDYDKASSTLDIAIAERKFAEATIRKIKSSFNTLNSQKETQKAVIEREKSLLEISVINLGRTTITAPRSGRIAKKNVDEGKYLERGDTLFAIVDIYDIWIEANLKETQIGEIRIGQSVDIEVDAYKKVKLKGHVDSFQPGAGAAFSLLPPEDATGNFVKVVRRVPVKIVVDSPFNPDAPLWPGMSVVPHIKLANATYGSLELGYDQ